jgi:peptidyl-dipeptidase Dcp
MADAQSRAQRAGIENAWIFGLDNPSVMPFLNSANDRPLRQEILHAFENRNNNNDDLDNKGIIKQILTLRLERAKLMGFKNFAEMINQERMPKSPEAVMDFLNSLWTPGLAAAKRELQDIEAEMRRARVPLPSTAGDWRFFASRARQNKFNINQTQISEHFAIDNVRQGIFYVCNRLWGITFEQLHGIPVPHPEAVAWKVLDRDGTTVLGVVYEDMHPRPGIKNGGAWCGAYRVTTYDENGNRIIPIVTLAGNFTRASGDKPAFLTSSEVGTYFHEWGHGLYHLFNETRYIGISRPQLDFIEFPSQIMEHWAFQPEVLRVYAKHYRTGRPISNALIRQIEQSGQYGEGFRMTDYLISAIIDMEYHMLPEIPADFDAVKFEYAVRDRIGAIPQIPARHRPTHFRHIFAGQYLAGYYMYRYAEQFDSDAFEAFQETGDIFNQELARKLRFEIFARGGTEDAMDLYKNFRGREPDVNALLRSRGLIK